MFTHTGFVVSRTGSHHAHRTYVGNRGWAGRTSLSGRNKMRQSRTHANYDSFVGVKSYICSLCKQLRKETEITHHPTRGFGYCSSCKNRVVMI